MIPKSQWGDGPWQSEPDEASWIDDATGLPCCAERGFSGAWCGYVGVPCEHPAFGLPYYVRLDKPPAPVETATDDMMRRYLEKARDDWEIARGRHPTQQFINHIGVHGGLTFAGDRKANPGLHWFGFDCMHGGDLSPMVDATVRLVRRRNRPTSGWHEEYRTLDYVREQCTQLARQLADIAATVSPVRHR